MGRQLGIRCFSLSALILQPREVFSSVPMIVALYLAIGELSVTSTRHKILRVDTRVIGVSLLGIMALLILAVVIKWRIYALVDEFWIGPSAFTVHLKKSHNPVQPVRIGRAICCHTWQTIPISFSQPSRISPS